MAVVGLVLGRARSSYTILIRPSIFQTNASKVGVTVPAAVITSRLITHASTSLKYLTAQILESLHKSISDIGASTSGLTVGIFPTRVPSHSGTGSSRRKVELVKLEGIICHELSKDPLTSIDQISLAEIRCALGITGARPADLRGKIKERFVESVPDRDNTLLNSGIQIMSESWGAANVVERKRVIAEFKATCPELMANVRKEVGGSKSFLRTEFGDETVCAELIESQVDQALVKRFNL